jgi:hypothetical protein
MTTATATLVHTSSREAVNADRMARVLAAGRVTDARKAREARDAAAVAHNLKGTTAWVESITALGAVEVGTKVCLADGGKWRTGLRLHAAADSLARWIADGDSVEAWGVNAAGEYVGEVLGVW